MVYIIQSINIAAYVTVAMTKHCNVNGQRDLFGNVLFKKSHQHMIFACPIPLAKCNSVEMHVCRGT